MVVAVYGLAQVGAKFLQQAHKARSVYACRLFVAINHASLRREDHAHFFSQWY